MADDNTPKEPASKVRPRATSARNKAQAEFDRYKARVGGQARAGGAAGFGRPPAFSIQGMPIGGWPGEAPFPGAPPGAPWSAPMPWPAPYATGPTPPQLGPGTLTDRLRTTLRLGVDVVNATLAGGLRVMGGLSDIAAWSWSDPSRGYRSHSGSSCGYGYASQSCGCHSSCGCDCCAVLSDPCCSPGVNSCGCSCCC
jgi:hypothetical protein